MKGVRFQGVSLAQEAKEAKKKLQKKMKMKLRFLIPVYKYFNPVKYIYYMDMVFPLNVLDAEEDDYHKGKLTLIRNCQLRPQVIFDKKFSLIIVVYDSGSVHILQNQCDYFIAYLNSLGHQTLREFATI